MTTETLVTQAQADIDRRDAEAIVAENIGVWGWSTIDEIEGLAEHTLAVDACAAGIAFARRRLTSLVGELETMTARRPYHVGYITKTDPKFIADEEGNALWEAEVQCHGGHAEIARTWAATPDEAQRQAQAIADALAALETRPSRHEHEGTRDGDR